MCDTALHRAVWRRWRTTLASAPTTSSLKPSATAATSSCAGPTVGGIVHRAEAVRTARLVPAVRHVEDGLEVRLMGIDGRADADTEAAVLDALAADHEVRARDIDVDVSDGAVTLAGLVEVVSQRDRAERIGLGVPGVASVANRLRVWLTYRPTKSPNA